MLLAAIAQVTMQIRLTSAISVLSTLDPVRLFEDSATLDLVSEGSPEQIVEKILQQHELFGHQRFLAQLDIGGQPFKHAAESIELLATEIAPVIRRETSK